MNFYYISDRTQPLRPLGLVVMDAQSHSYTGKGCWSSGFGALCASATYGEEYPHGEDRAGG